MPSRIGLGFSTPFQAAYGETGPPRWSEAEANN
jgi:hypothetical protein